MSGTLAPEEGKSGEEHQSVGDLGLESPEIWNPSESWDFTESLLIPREKTGTSGAP